MQNQSTNMYQAAGLLFTLGTLLVITGHPVWAGSFTALAVVMLLNAISKQEGSE